MYHFGRERESLNAVLHLAVFAIDVDIGYRQVRQIWYTKGMIRRALVLLADSISHDYYRRGLCMGVIYQQLDENLGSRE